MPRAMLNVNELNTPNPPEQVSAEPVTEQEPAAQAAPAAPAAQPVINRRAARETEQKAENNTPPAEDPQAKYASAFPAWDLTPPQVLIRRVNRNKI